jgi:four helix bundle protein
MSQPPQPFRALSLSYDLIEALSSVIPAIREHDASLADQLRRAAQSVALNLAESTGNSRGNRRSRIETAFGSTQETKAALHIARCWRYVDEAAIRRAFDLADDIAKLCWRLTR